MTEPARWRLLAGAAAAALLPVLGVGTSLTSDAHEGHDPVHGLQQLDQLHLDEPAPGLRPTGGVVVLVFCDTCELPDIARATVDGRYRTYDPFVGEHGIEIQTVLDGVLRS